MSDSHAGGVRFTHSSPSWRSADLNFPGSNPILPPMRFGICSEIFKDWKLEDAMVYARKAGYDAIEIAPFTIANYVTDIPAAQRTEIREAAARAGIAISGIHWVLVQAEGMYLNHPDTSVRSAPRSISATSLIFARTSVARPSSSARRSSGTSWKVFRLSKPGTGLRPPSATR